LAIVSPCGYFTTFLFGGGIAAGKMFNGGMIRGQKECFDALACFGTILPR
jgi:hypothetical protein